MRLAHRTEGDRREWDIGTGDAENFGQYDNFGFRDVTIGKTVMVLQQSSSNVGIGTTKSKF